MITRQLVIFIGNTMVAEMRLLKNSTTGQYENGASVQVTIKEGGTTVTGPLTMTYVPGSRGVYRGTISASISVDEASEYVAQVVATGPGGSRGEWQLPVVAMYRDR